MVGYRTEFYKKFGKFPAKLDDIINWAPVRLTAALIRLSILIGIFGTSAHKENNTTAPILVTRLPPWRSISMSSLVKIHVTLASLSPSLSLAEQVAQKSLKKQYVRQYL